MKRIKKEAISKDEIEKLRTQAEQQLNYAKQQTVFWSKKMQQLTGSLAICNIILKKKTKKEKDK